MKRLLLLTTLLAATLARPQDDDSFLASLFGDDPPTAAPTAAPTDASTAAPAVADVCSNIATDDDSFLAALTNGCDGIPTQPEGPPARCHRSQFTCTPYFRCAEQHIVADRVDEFNLRINKHQFDADFEFIKHSDCPLINDVCCEQPQPETGKPSVPDGGETYVPQCGRRNEFGVGARITGFNESESQFGETPWTAVVLRAEEVGGEERQFFVCGGTLVHPRAVLTAAHCVDAIQDARLRVRLGEWDTQNEVELFPHVDVDVQQVVVHEDFHPRKLNDDVALLILAQPAPLSEHIDTLCLPEPGVSYDHAQCIATGWGKDAFQTGQFQTVMKLIDVPHVPHDQCEAALKQTRLRKYFRLDRSFTCAGGVGGEDTCTGDGGSPLACVDPAQPDRYVQLGVVSWGIGCGLEGVPGVYADVSRQTDWIKSHLVGLPIA